LNEAKVKLNKDTRGVVTITMCRSEKHNAFDDDMISALHEIFLNLAEQKDVHVVVLAAEGKSFSAGADVNWMRRMAAYTYQENVRDARVLADMLASLDILPQTTIARVQGSAFGGAIGLISCCDLVFATSTAKFCLSEVKLGLIPAVISPYVVSAMGTRAARRYFQTAEVFSVHEALHLGLVTEVVEDNSLENKIDDYVSRLLTNSPAAMRQAKLLVRDVAGKQITDALLRDTSERIAKIRMSQQGQEGLAAFLEKRKPVWVE